MAHHVPAAANGQAEISLADTEHIYFMNLVQEQKQTSKYTCGTQTHTHTVDCSGVKMCSQCCG